MTTMTINIPDDVAEDLRRQAGEAGRDVADLAGQQIVQYHEELGMREATLDRAFERDQDRIKSVVESRLADGTAGRPADEVFAELEARAHADAHVRGVDDAVIAELLGRF